jgi:hypothetical protein
LASYKNAIHSLGMLLTKEDVTKFETSATNEETKEITAKA